MKIKVGTKTDPNSTESTILKDPEAPPVYEMKNWLIAPPVNNFMGEEMESSAAKRTYQQILTERAMKKAFKGILSRPQARLLMKNPYRQVGLQHEKVKLVVNLPDDPKLKAGNLVTLKDHPQTDIKWLIQWVSKHTIERSHLNRTWNNNI